MTDLKTLTLPALYTAQVCAATVLDVAKLEAARIKQEIGDRLSTSAAAAFIQADKTHGTMALPLQDGLTAKVEIKQTVKWDSAKLLAVAQTLPWERVTALFKIDLSMSEAVYKGVAALSPEMRERIDAARTTTLAMPAITLTSAA